VELLRISARKVSISANRIDKFRYRLSILGILILFPNA